MEIISNYLIEIIRVLCLIACGICAFILMLASIDSSRRKRNCKVEFMMMIAVLMYYPVTQMYANSDVKLTADYIFLVRLSWFLMFTFASSITAMLIKARNRAHNSEIFGEIIGYAYKQTKQKLTIDHRKTKEG